MIATWDKMVLIAGNLDGYIAIWNIDKEQSVGGGGIKYLSRGKDDRAHDGSILCLDESYGNLISLGSDRFFTI